MPILLRFTYAAACGFGLLVIPALMLFLTHSFAWAGLCFVLVLMGLVKSLR